MESETADDAMEVDGDDVVRDDVEPVSHVPCLCLHARAPQRVFSRRTGLNHRHNHPDHLIGNEQNGRKQRGIWRKRSRRWTKRRCVSFLPYTRVGLMSR